LKAPLRHLLDGRLTPWNGPTTVISSPIWIQTPEGPARFHVGLQPAMGEEESLAALESAVRAWDHGLGVWPQMRVSERIKHVSNFAARMKAKRDEIARLMMWEIAKPLSDCYKEFDRTVDYIRDTIDALKDLDRTASRFQVTGGFLAQVRRSPLGVTLCMGPFNYPLNETFTTLIPALIMGNPVIFKTPRMGVALFEPLLEAFAECFPAGVINVLYGDGARVVGPLMTSGKVDVLAFIGSARVGNILKHQHPNANRLRCVLGLDAKNPAIVLESADVDLAVTEALLGSYSFNGQRCTAIKIIFVHRAIADAFITRFRDGVQKLVAGDPWKEGVQITPLAEEGKGEWLAKLITDAQRRGARVINEGGGSVHRTHFTPAALFPVSLEAEVCKVEQFGPVLPIVPFDKIEDVLTWMKSSPYGQQAALFGRDAQVVGPLVDALANLVCRVNINCQCQRGPDLFPFAGRKDSAEGTLSVSDALRAFSIRSMAAAKSTPGSEALVNEIVSEHHSKFLSTDFIF
jgi:glyceraldehyde-3-phosphate dehydrogenase (NADP+)